MPKYNNANSLVIANTSIRQDAEGRYCLNDLHRASGGDNKNKPNIWTANQQTKDLVLEIEIAGNPAIVSKQKIGTYACKELVYAYAMWISPKFHLAVIRAYDALVTENAYPARIANQDAIQQASIQVMLLESFASKANPSQSSLARSYAAIGASHGVDTSFLPSYTDEKLTRSLSELLKINGSVLSATKANKILLELGYLQKLTRPSTGKTTKEFWNITPAGLKYGENAISVKNDKETQPRWFEETFTELLDEINHKTLCAA
jgi:hypothetical protein